MSLMLLLMSNRLLCSIITYITSMYGIFYSISVQFYFDFIIYCFFYCFIRCSCLCDPVLIHFYYTFCLQCAVFVQISPLYLNSFKDRDRCFVDFVGGSPAFSPLFFTHESLVWSERLCCRELQLFTLMVIGSRYLKGISESFLTERSCVVMKMLCDAWQVVLAFILSRFWTVNCNYQWSRGMWSYCQQDWGQLYYRIQWYLSQGVLWENHPPSYYTLIYSCSFYIFSWRDHMTHQ